MLSRLKLLKLRQLSGKEIRLLAEAWWALLLADLSLRVLPLPRVQRMLAGSPSPPSAKRDLDLQRTAWLVHVAARHHILPIRCLQRALALQRVLSKRGLVTDLKIGVQRRDGNLFAHAWLEADGLPLAESEEIDRRFPPLLGTRR